MINAIFGTWIGSSVKDYKLPVQPNVMNNNHFTASVGEAFWGLLLQSSSGAALSEKPLEGDMTLRDFILVRPLV